jgi:hypothetical protein
VRFGSLLLVPCLVACGAASPEVPARDGGVNAPDGGVRDGGAPADGGAPTDAGVPTSCDDGAARSMYSLFEVSPVPHEMDLSLPELPAATNVVSAEVDQLSLVRIEVCSPTGGAPRVASILWGGLYYGLTRHWIVDDTVSSPTERLVTTPLGEVTEVRMPSELFVVEGLADAMGGVQSSLHIRVLGVGGLVLDGDEDFVAAVRGEVTADTIDYDTPVVTVGRFGAGDVLEDLFCPLTQWSRVETFELGTARFEVQGCFFLGGGHTEGYRFVRLTVEDDNAALDPADRVPHVFTSEAEVEAVMNYRWNHHNACDSFHLALPHADYAASAAPFAGCGPTVDNAPERDFDEPSNSPVKYRVRYGGGAWTDGEIDGCWHYLFCDS